MEVLTAYWQPILVITVLILLDIITGLCVGFKEKNLNSGKMREGLWHKAGYYALVLLAAVFEIGAAWINFDSTSLGLNINIVELPAVGAVCAFIAITELVSIIENICALNPKIESWPVINSLRPRQKDEPDMIVAVEDVAAIDQATNVASESPRGPTS